MIKKTIGAFIKSHPLLSSSFAQVFIISQGGMLIVVSTLDSQARRSNSMWEIISALNGAIMALLLRNAPAC